ncbi:alpha/beta fold hydrolase [Streptomonospora nanhaiensis]|uniref:alpha/beta fold hydrolase n=1 Tax=Streptomonospora nanhaiensis TaxID=1323731 RepID=UPI001C3942DD|nr:alpha/beta fold hydrolase [Streptomonospora nanhaiensis]MBV2364216.1 alpha/beta hydrolase [Streptomonospora nanhaiensis]
MHRRPAATAAVLPLALAAALTFPPGPAWAQEADAAEAPAAGSGQRLDWGACPEGDYGTGMECATLRVPVDHDRPRGRHITLTVGRLPETGRGGAEGSVVVNPGGPIGFSIAYLAAYGDSFAGLREHMDIVTWDLRGAPNGQGGFSTPLDCDWRYAATPAVPADQAAFAELAAANRAVAQECRAAGPALFDHMSSADHADDLEAIRAALGERRLNLHMTSYGGVIGQSYARQYPDRVRTLYLDGTADHTREGDAVYEGFARDGDTAFDRFADWCAAEESCALHGSDVAERWRALTARADADPIPAPVAGVHYTGRDLEATAFAVLTANRPGATWRELAEAVLAAEDGDASGFVRDPDRPFPGFPQPGVVECLDWNRPADHAQMAATVARLSEVAPNTGGRLHMYGSILTCAGWPTPVTNPPGPLPEGVPPLLGAGTWSDFGSTSRAVASVPGSVSIVHDGPGHGLYWNGNACVVAHADTYLRTRELPPPGTGC